MWRWGVLLLVGCAGAASTSTSTPTPTPTATATATATPNPTATPIAKSEDCKRVAPASSSQQPPVAVPAPINEPGKRKVDTAVVFFGPPHGPLYEDDGIAPVRAAWLTPAVCVEKKKLRFGPDCGALVPAVAKVRLSSGRELTLSRGGGVRDRENPGAITAPYAPACCMYTGCHGRAMPFVPKEGPFQATRNLVAVWPADADVGLDIPFDYPELKDGPENVFQSFEIRGQEYATTGTRLSGGQLLHRENGAWMPLDIPGFNHSRAVAVLAVTDLDGDGKNELLAYAAWANDYGFAVVVEGRKDSPYNYSCGNI